VSPCTDNNLQNTVAQNYFILPNQYDTKELLIPCPCSCFLVLKLYLRIAVATTTRFVDAIDSIKHALQGTRVLGMSCTSSSTGRGVRVLVAL
jgi:hypothetical protein